MAMLLVPKVAPAQLARKSQEVRSSPDLYDRLNPKLRFYFTLTGTRLNTSSYSDAAAGLFVAYFTYSPGIFTRHAAARNVSLPGRFIWLRAGNQYSVTPPSAKDPFKESMIVTEANSRFYKPFNRLLTWKKRFNWHSKNNNFDGRHRPHLMMERYFRIQYLFLTASGFVEYFSHSLVNSLNTQLGVEMMVTRRMNYEVFRNHQFAHAPEIPEVDAFGMTLKFYFTHKKQEPKKTPETRQKKQKPA